jgi:prepilin signal peptidase PulO-like enzyme (type II secretory pathway)
MEYITTANVLVWLFIALGFFLMFVSYWLAAAALFPRHIDRCSDQFASPLLITLLGLLLTVVPIAAGITVLNVAPAALKWIGLLMVAVPLLAGLIGSAGLARRIGVGLPSPRDVAQPWRAVLRGGIVLALTFLLPILGQILLIPAVLAAGTGAAAFSWWGERSRRRQHVPDFVGVTSPKPDS